MKIGYVQFEPELGRPDETIRRLEPLLAKGADADLLVLPELANSGYNFESEQQLERTAEEADSSRFLGFIKEHCRRNNQHIVTGFNEKSGKRFFNSAALVGPDGTIGIYRKLHLFMDEKDRFESGDLGLPVFDIGVCKLGMLVCFDWMFPEAWRVLALKGADIICHPSNLVLPGFAQKAVPVHALLSHVFVITANRIGAERELTFTGLSTIASPKGEVLLQGSSDVAEVRVVDIDVEAARNKSITPRNDVFADRRPEQYGEPVKP